MKNTIFILIALLSLVILSCGDTKNDSNRDIDYRENTKKSSKTKDGNSNKRSSKNFMQIVEEALLPTGESRNEDYATVDTVGYPAYVDSAYYADSAYYYEEYAPAMCDSTVYYDSISAW